MRRRMSAVDNRGRRFFQNLLMAAFHGALALAEVNRVAVFVGEHLHLDVPGIHDGFSCKPHCRRRNVRPRARRLREPTSDHPAHAPDACLCRAPQRRLSALRDNQFWRPTCCLIEGFDAALKCRARMDSCLSIAWRARVFGSHSIHRSRVGPMNFTPASAQACANFAFSERKP